MTIHVAMDESDHLAKHLKPRLLHKVADMPIQLAG